MLRDKKTAKHVKIVAQQRENTRLKSGIKQGEKNKEVKQI